MPDNTSPYADYAQSVARRYGLDPGTFVRQLALESDNWNPAVLNGTQLGSSGEVGGGQFMPDTSAALAKQWGWNFNPADPHDAIEASGRYMAQLQKKYGGDNEKALAAYNAGEPAVDNAITKSKQSQHDLTGMLGITDKSWQSILAKTAPSTVDTYLPSIVQKDASGKAIQPSSSFVAGQTPVAGTHRDLTQDDFTTAQLDENGNPTGKSIPDSKSWLAYQQARDYASNRQFDVEDRATAAADRVAKEKHADRGDLADYLDSVAKGMEADVASGNLTLSKAQAQFKKNLDAFDSGNTALTSLMGYSIPTSAQYVPGFEPGGLGAKYGLAPIKGSGQIVDPFQQALQLAQQSPDFTTLPTQTTMQDKVMQAFSGAGMTPPSSQPPPMSPPPPATGAPPNAFQAALQNAQQSQETTANEQYMRQMGGY